jgi:flagellar basal-body rod modification protein FlgD
MISSINAISGTEDQNLYTEKTDQDLGRDDFLKLFLAQLNHQDPLNPMDSTQFSAQLAQFSSLEQLFNVNSNLKAIKGLQVDNSRMKALDLIGKEIEAEGNVIYLEQGRPSTGGFTLDGKADTGVLIRDLNGYPIREIQLGSLNPGEHTFEWDGRDSQGNYMGPGIYSFEVAAVSESGELTPSATRIKGRVDRVNLEGENPLLYMGDIFIPISKVVDVTLYENGEDAPAP